jgi:hypothetical protein
MASLGSLAILAAFVLASGAFAASIVGGAAAGLSSTAVSASFMSSQR